MEKIQKRKKVHYGRIIFLICVLVFIALGFARIFAKPDPYNDYKNVNSETKLAGEAKELFQEISDEKVKFFHYPEFDQETMNKTILTYVNELPDENGITFLDYESNHVLDAYTNIIFKYQLLDMDQHVQKEHKKSFTFSNQSGEVVQIDDVLRRDYIDLIKEQFKKQAGLNLDKIDAIELSIGEDALHLRAENKEIKLPYADFKSYMKLPGKGINERTLEVKRSVDVDPNKPMIALTFDDGPSPYTDEFLDVFEQNNATASFFMLGKNLQHYPDTLTRMVERGFEICNHSWDHKSINSDDATLIKQEIFDTQDAMYRMTGHEPTRIRPPYGEYNKLSEAIAEDNGIGITLWNVDTQDWKNRDASITLQHAKAGIQDGAIILFHDLYPTSLQAIKELVPYIQSQGYQLVTVSDLIKYKY